MNSFGFAYITEKLKWTPIILKSDWVNLFSKLQLLYVIFYGNENPFKENTMVYYV